ncbi:MAG: hypothetical protein ABFS45_20035 [Pseudomonadota bacterium]
MKKQTQSHELHDGEIQGQKEGATHQESQNKRYDVFFHVELRSRQEPPEKIDQSDEYSDKEQRPRPRISILLLSLIVHVLSPVSALLIDAANYVIYDHLL